jgi:hypothetical protein
MNLTKPETAKSRRNKYHLDQTHLAKTDLASFSNQTLAKFAVVGIAEMAFSDGCC